MNIKVAYLSRTGHSRKLAGAIADALRLEAENIADNPYFEGIDLLFLAGGIYGSESLPEMLSFVKSLNPAKVKQVALVTSCVSQKKQQDSVRRDLTDKGIRVIDEFMCQGSLLFIGLKHPDREDLDRAASFALHTAARAEGDFNKISG